MFSQLNCYTVLSAAIGIIMSFYPSVPPFVTLCIVALSRVGVEG